MAGTASIGVPTDQRALWSLISALVGVVCCGLVLGPVAFFLGNSALARIRASNGTVGGENLAQIGRILGLAVAVLWLLAVIGVVISVLNRSTAV